MTDASKLGKIFIGGLSYETTDEKLRSYFGAFGSVTDAVVMKDPISRRSRGFGFITYADPACVDRALAQPSHVLDSRRVEAKRAVPRADNSREVVSTTIKPSGPIVLPTLNSACASGGATKKIFVGGLHYETKDAEFKKYFQKYGKVVSAEVMFNRETNKSRGFGFVIFENEQSVDLILNERDHMIDGKLVEVKRAVPRTDVPPIRAIPSRETPSSATGSVESNEDAVNLKSGSSTLNGPPALVQPVATTKSNASSVPSANLLPNGILRGYAAAVRYGGRGIPRDSHSASFLSPTSASALEGEEFLEPSPIASSPLQPSTGQLSSNFSLGGVAEALNSLNIKEETSPRTSKASSDESCDKLPESYSNESVFEGFKSSLPSSLSTQWHIPSTVAPPIRSPATPKGHLETSDLEQPSFLNSGLSDSNNHFPWQSSSWQHASWGAIPPAPSDDQVDTQHPRSPSTSLPSIVHSTSASTPSLFSMFSSTTDAWPRSQQLGDTNGSCDDMGFGGMMGMNLNLHPTNSSFQESLGIGAGLGTNPLASPALSGIFSQDSSDVEPRSNGALSNLDSMLGRSLCNQEDDPGSRISKQFYYMDQDRSRSSLGTKLQESAPFSFQDEQSR
uniref:Heterogeneous nuclear ribonucleoprotein A1 putative n=1 Tax=Albugo laibachii Nc14 TaxID=890382 RepID=F0VZ11_9STRA|nr:heterogeneous nuclear ribonucleoprotein A1 putative [Albugo laibachii Nc14]|eukprot:CCA14026.1 heterogeneous nuclear ribonucleoprotein A1 putative [Albugo laibachii Nc14]